MSVVVWLAALLAAETVLPTPAPTAAPVPAAPPLIASPPPAPEGWYGKPAAIVDAAAITLLATGLAFSGPSSPRGDHSSYAGIFTVIGIGGFFLGAPAVHVQNGHVGKAAASLGLRAVGAITGGYVLLTRILKCDPESAGDIPGCQTFSGGEMAMITIPFVAAAAVDDMLLAYGTIPAPVSAGGATLTPIVGPGAFALSLAGRF